MYNVCMIKLGRVSFEWDESKNRQNKNKHHIDFREAATIFINTPLRVFFDPDHSETEDRYLAIGESLHSRTLVVVHCESNSGHKVRIISARKATKTELKLLFGG